MNTDNAMDILEFLEELPSTGEEAPAPTGKVEGVASLEHIDLGQCQCSTGDCGCDCDLTPLLD
jgi:hypothetical protein